MNGTLVKANNDLFAVYQTIYADEDTNLHYEWTKRLEDTKGMDTSYWVMQEDVRIGGILILKDCTRFPFLIEPFCDRFAFWRIVLAYLHQNRPDIKKLCSLPDADLPVLLSFGYKIGPSRRMMCRPTDTYDLMLEGRFSSALPDPSRDLEEMAEVIVNGYQGGVDYLLDPESNEEENRKEARGDLAYFLKGYVTSGSLHHSVLIRDQKTGRIAALCIAGQHPQEGHPRFSNIADIMVLPAYRGLGLAKYMIQNALTKAAPTHDALSLCVTVGNRAEALYRKMGFWGAPRFTEMSRLG